MAEIQKTTDVADTTILIWQIRPPQRLAFRCSPCGGSGRSTLVTIDDTICESCGGHGWYGLLGWLPTSLTEHHKVPMLMSRYVSGLKLFDGRDAPEMQERRNRDGSRTD